MPRKFRFKTIQLVWVWSPFIHVEWAYILSANTVWQPQIRPKIDPAFLETYSLARNLAQIECVLCTIPILMHHTAKTAKRKHEHFVEILLLKYLLHASHHIHNHHGLHGIPWILRHVYHAINKSLYSISVFIYRKVETDKALPHPFWLLLLPRTSHRATSK